MKAILSILLVLSTIACRAQPGPPPPPGLFAGPPPPSVQAIATLPQALTIGWAAVPDAADYELTWWDTTNEEGEIDTEEFSATATNLLCCRTYTMTVSARDGYDDVSSNNTIITYFAPLAIALAFVPGALQSSPDLVAWTTLASNTTAYVDINTGPAAKFYRVLPRTLETAAVIRRTK